MHGAPAESKAAPNTTDGRSPRSSHWVVVFDPQWPTTSAPHAPACPREYKDTCPGRETGAAIVASCETQPSLPPRTHMHQVALEASTDRETPGYTLADWPGLLHTRKCPVTMSLLTN